MTGRTHSRLERLAAVGVLLAILGAIGGAVVPGAVASYRATQAEIAALRVRHSELLERQRDLAALARLRDSLAAAEPQAFGLVVADSVELARAELQRTLQDFAAEAGGTVAQIRPVDAPTPDMAAAAFKLHVPSEALPAFLLLVANAEPLIFVDALEARSQARQTGAGGPDLLQVELTLSSYVATQRPGEGR